MRIVGGQLRGRSIIAPKGNATRPTTDRTRESLFNILENRVSFNQMRVLDLFAGTGALGLEAMSRGSEFCLFVEEASQARAAIQRNIDALDLASKTKLLRRDATRLGPVGTFSSFDIVFADPPYGKGLGEIAAKNVSKNHWLKADGLFVLEEHSRSFPETVNGFALSDLRQFGETSIGIFQLSD